MARPMNDLLVVLPGILGTELRKDGRLLWGFPDGLRGFRRARGNLRTAIADLMLHGDDPRAEHVGDGVQATQLISIPQIVAGLIKSDGYDLLRERLFEHFQFDNVGQTGGPMNYLEFPYDWRRDNRAAAHRLQRVVAEALRRLREDTDNPEAKVIFICHSMGGLVARYFLEVLGGWETCRALITFGTPYRGAVNALNFLVHGYTLAGVDLTEVLRTCTALYQLLPVYEMVDVGGGTFRRVAEIDNVPNVTHKAAKDAREFHEEIRRAVEARSNRGYLIFPIAGVEQPTLQSAELTDGVLTVSRHVPDSWPTHRENGDGTVPYVSAIPLEMSNDPRGWFTVPTCHAMLQSSEDAWAHVRRILDRLQDPSLGDVRAPETGAALWAPPAIQLRVRDLYTGADPVTLVARIVRPSAALNALEAELRPAEQGAAPRQLPLAPAGDDWLLTVPDLPSGLYRVQVRTVYAGQGAPVPVEDVFEVDRTV